MKDGPGNFKGIGHCPMYNDIMYRFGGSVKGAKGIHKIYIYGLCERENEG